MRHECKCPSGDKSRSLEGSQNQHRQSAISTPGAFSWAPSARVQTDGRQSFCRASVSSKRRWGASSPQPGVRFALADVLAPSNKLRLTYMTVWGCRSRACLPQFQLSQALEATPAALRHGAGVAGLSILHLAPAAAAMNSHASSLPLLRGTPVARETWRLKLPPGMQSASIPIKHFSTLLQSALVVWCQTTCVCIRGSLHAHLLL